jgi:hypothetical protein
MAAATKECFVISPIGEEGTPTRRLADTLLNYVVAPAVKPLGYEPIRADELGDPGDISDQVIEHLRDADLAIAILHETNPNVFYEMAVRHTLARPLIPLAPKGAPIPFDVRGIRTVHVDTADPASVQSAIKQIQGQATAFEKDPVTVVNPVTRVISARMAS